MKHFIIIFVLLTASFGSWAKPVNPQNPTAIIHTSKGPITLELYAQKSPITVANFIDYANTGYYEGTIFHRVIKRFMIQGGGFTKEMAKKTTKDAIVNESTNGLHNDRWTVAMARTDDADSATSQFFINVSMNSKLDAGRGKVGYTVFAKVIEGQYVVKAIEKVATRSFSGYSDVPIKPVLIEKVDIIIAGATAASNVQ
ncbi:MAG: cyclophilin family peptidyl-prolyl cis-trans isomerase [Oceanicoccus sp.]|jgi:cyclophilin family peptidyl-prolyl cis-trans isomerase